MGLSARLGKLLFTVSELLKEEQPSISLIADPRTMRALALLLALPLLGARAQHGSLWTYSGKPGPGPRAASFLVALTPAGAALRGCKAPNPDQDKRSSQTPRFACRVFVLFCFRTSPGHSAGCRAHPPLLTAKPSAFSGSARGEGGGQRAPCDLTEAGWACESSLLGVGVLPRAPRPAKNPASLHGFPCTHPVATVLGRPKSVHLDTGHPSHRAVKRAPAPGPLLLRCTKGWGSAGHSGLLEDPLSPWRPPLQLRTQDKAGIQGGCLSCEVKGNRIRDMLGGSERPAAEGRTTNSDQPLHSGAEGPTHGQCMEAQGFCLLWLVGTRGASVG